MARKLFLALLVIALFTGMAFAQTTGLSQTMDLKSGFNFVSFTVKPNFSAADFKNRNTSIQEVYSFSATSGSFLSVSEGTLINLAAGKGYIVKASAPAVLTITGEAIQTVGTLNLKAGFNLIGISKPLTGSKFSDLIRSYSVVRALYRYSAASGSFIQVMKGASGIADLLDGIDPAFTAGQAYFMNVETDTTLNYDNGSMVMPGGSTALTLQAPVISYDATTRILSWQPVTPPKLDSVVEYKIVVNGIEKMMWAQTSLNLGTTNIVDFSTDQTVTVKAVVYSLDLTSAPSNSISIRGGSSTTLPAVVGLRYDASGNKLTWTAATGAYYYYIVKIDGQTYDAYSMNEFMLSNAVPAIAAGSHTAQVAVKEMGTSTSTGPWSPEPALAFTTGSTAASTLEVTFNPKGGSFPNAELSVTITPVPAEAKVFFTIDGTIPVTDPTAVPGPKTLRIPAGRSNYKIMAMAHLNGQNSRVAEQIYNTTGGTAAATLEVTFSPVGGTYPNANLDVNLTARPSNAFVWYTNDGTDPRTSPTVITATIAGYPVRVIVTAGRTNYTIKAVATLNGQFSDVVSNTYSANGAGTTEVSIHMPLIAPMDVSTLSGSDSVTLTLDPADYAIYNTLKIKYTIDGSVPTLSSPEYYAGTQLFIPTGLTQFTVKAIATNGVRISPVSSKTYTITGGTTTVTVPPVSNIMYDPGTRRVVWTVPNGLPKPYYVSSCELTSNNGAMEFNGMIPMGSNFMNVPTGLSWDTATTVTAKVKLILADTQDNLHNPATTVSGPETTSEPLAIGGGTAPTLPVITGLGYDQAGNKLTWARPAGTTYYYYTVRFDNSVTAEAYSMNELMLSNITPALTAGTHRFQVAAKEMGMGTTLGPWSAEFSFTIGGATAGTVANPVTDVAPGNYNIAKSVSLTCTTPASVIKYTVSTAAGTEPLDPKVNGTIFVAANPIPLPANTYLKIKFYAYAAGMQDSTVLEAVYNSSAVVRPAAPTGFVYDAASKKLKWNPITAPAGGTVFYYLSLNSGTFSLVNATEYDMTGLPAGRADLYAKIFDTTGNNDTLTTSVSYPASAPAVK